MSVVVSTNRDEKLKINVSKPILASEIGQFFMSAGWHYNGHIILSHF